MRVELLLPYAALLMPFTRMWKRRHDDEHETPDFNNGSRDELQTGKSGPFRYEVK